ncbi:MAG: hypothetical protein IJT00_07990 [Lachnospiraceae bacterium]|nr:hypothetical protein [Lachnospiraceae bacterium]
MSVNGITGSYQAVQTAYSATKAPAKETKQTDQAAEKTSKFSDTAAVYEKSEEAVQAEKDGAQKVYDKTSKVANPELAAKLKADLEDRTAQLRSIVEKLIIGQGKASGIASGDDMWKLLAEGKLEVDPATRAQAQEDISEDGYWGVKQTSERIIEFAKSLAGNDPEKLENMREAFEKGYKQAEKTWGGELPQISKDTFDAVQKAFDELTKKTQETGTTQS